MRGPTVQSSSGGFALNEIITGIFTWAWFSQPHGYNFDGYLVRHPEGNLCIDPVPPGDADLAEIVRIGVSKVLLTNRNHSRAANLVRERTCACRVIGPMTLLGESRLNHLGKLAFKPFYWHMLLPGHHIPLVGSQMSTRGKRMDVLAARAHA